MVFVTIVLIIASGAFYSAANYGLAAGPLCHYGEIFCTHPSWLGIAALFALIWTLFLRVDRI